jgi:histidinol phosphatase-like PHP family hydrolase
MMHSSFRCPKLPVAVFNCDLHCHSTCSDGLLAAADVARSRGRNGVDMLALTDHDDLEGLLAASAAAADGRHGFRQWRRDFDRVGGAADPHSGLRLR